MYLLKAGAGGGGGIARHARRVSIVKVAGPRSALQASARQLGRDHVENLFGCSKDFLSTTVTAEHLKKNGTRSLHSLSTLSIIWKL